MAGKYLIDTNAVIDYLDNKLPATGANMLDRGNLHIFGNYQNGIAGMAKC